LHQSMEFFGARPERPIETCLDEVRKSQVLVVIVGGRYGSLVPNWGISYSEAEYQEAYRLSIPCLVYFRGAVEPSDEHSEHDPTKAALLERWKQTLRERHTCAEFKRAGELALQVSIDVSRVIKKIEEDSGPSPRSTIFSMPRDKADTGPSLTPVSCQRFGDESRQLLHGLATDPEGNIIIVGDFWGRIDFGCSELTSDGDRDIFLAKFNPAGKCIWSHRYGDQLEQVGAGVSTDSHGAVFVAGSFNGTLDFGGGVLVSRGRYNVALAKLDQAGRHLWSCCFGDSKYHVAECIAVSPAGWVAVAGRFQGTIDFGGGSLESKSAQTDIFLAVFSAAGEFRWAKRFGGPHEQQTRSIAIDANGNIGLTGVFKGAISFGNRSLTEELPGDYCGFLTRFDEFGNVTWCKRYGDPSVEQGSVVSFDRATSDLLTAGFMRNKLPRESSNGASAICLFARYDSAGVLRWSKAFGTHAIASSLSVASDGRVLLTGYFQGIMDLGLGPLTSAGGYDVFAAIFSGEGDVQWVRRYGDQRQQFLISGAYGHEGSIVLGGSFHGTIDFGSGPLVATGYDGIAECNEDVFLAVLQESRPGSRNNNQTANPDIRQGLNDIRRILEAQGDRFNPHKLLAKYPLGYVIFDLDYENRVIPYDTKLILDKYDLNWSVVRFTKNSQDRIEIRLPDAKTKTGDTALSHAVTGGAKKVGNLGGFLINDLSVSAEVLSIRETGIVFLIGFQRSPVFLRRR